MITKNLKLLISFIVGIVVGVGGTLMFMMWLAARN